MNTTKKKQLLNIDTTVEESGNNSSSTLIERKPIKNTPFQIISENGYHFGVMAEYRITEKYNSIEEVEKELQEITWNRIIQITALLIEKLK